VARGCRALRRVYPVQNRMGWDRMPESRKSGRRPVCPVIGARRGASRELCGPVFAREQAVGGCTPAISFPGGAAVYQLSRPVLQLRPFGHGGRCAVIERAWIPEGRRSSTAVEMVRRGCVRPAGGPSYARSESASSESRSPHRSSPGASPMAGHTFALTHGALVPAKDEHNEVRRAIASGPRNSNVPGGIPCP